MKLPSRFRLSRRLSAAALGFWLSLLPIAAAAETSLTVATWNVGLRNQTVEALRLNDFLEEVDFDILLVNEIKTEAELEALKAAMGREDYFSTISAFQNGDRNLEVGIISRFPLDNIVEFDRSPDISSIGVTERRLERVDLPGIANLGVGRGFLVAEVPDQNLFVIVSHFKSSLGRSGDADLTNAQKRELVAAAVAAHTVELLAANPDHTVVFGGDVNVGVSDSDKNGVSLIEDDIDGYDETHALLGSGLVDGLRMRSLAQDLGSTFVGDDNIPDFIEAGAIDVLYVAGALEDEFGDAIATSSAFGSDHLAVFATTAPVSGDDSGAVSIVNALPNPDGADYGREQVTLRYEGTGTKSIAGWFMRDASNNTYVFPADSVLLPGENTFTLRQHTMPLNNGGDTITLFDQNAVPQGEVFTYSRQDVVSGGQVR